MKKILIGTSALVAAGFIAAPGAMAAEKINLGLGGFMSTYAGYSTQDDSFEKATSTSYSRFDVKSNTEVYVQGSTKLDNGLTVGVQVQIEANKDQANTAGNSIDWSWMYVSSPEFGTIQMGGVGDTASQMLHNAPEAGNSNQYAAENSIREWVIDPGVNDHFWTFDVEDSASINYISPSFAGFKFGLGYTPDTADTINNPQHNANANGGVTSKNTYSAAYDATFDGVSVGVDVAHWSWDVNAGTGIYGADMAETRVGLGVGFAGFKVGGSYKRRSVDNNSSANGATEGKAYDLGAMYSTGPYAVSLSWFKSVAEGSATVAGDDEFSILNLGGKYAMGPGVDLKGSIAKVKYEDETNAVNLNNEGWTAHAGLSLGF